MAHAGSQTKTHLTEKPTFHHAQAHWWLLTRLLIVTITQGSSPESRENAAQCPAHVDKATPFIAI